MRILLVDDHRLVADALAIMLQDLGAKVEVTICHTSQRALNIVDESPPFDLILSDIIMPGIDGMGFLHGLKARSVHAPIVFISGSTNARIAQAALDQGAAGFIKKSLPGAEMLQALRKVLRGERLPNHLVNSQSSESLRIPAIESQQGGFGPRQHEVLQLIADGNSNKQIAHLLAIAETTVKYHTKIIFRHLGVRNRTSCIREARRLNLIENNETTEATEPEDTNSNHKD